MLRKCLVVCCATVNVFHSMGDAGLLRPKIGLESSDKIW
jgi:hypothetical protein